MKEVLVYDCGLSGRILGRYIRQELNIDVGYVVDSDLAKMKTWSQREVEEKVAKFLRPFIGQAEVIVIANPTIALMTEEYLKRKFPEQKFLGYGLDLVGLMKDVEEVLVLTSDEAKRTERYQRMKATCAGVKILEPDCKSWIESVREGREIKRETAEGIRIIICNSTLLLMEKKLAKMVGWWGEVVDMREEMLAGLREELEL